MPSSSKSATGGGSRSVQVSAIRASRASARTLPVTVDVPAREHDAVERVSAADHRERRLDDVGEREVDHHRDADAAERFLERRNPMLPGPRRQKLRQRRIRDRER